MVDIQIPKSRALEAQSKPAT